MPKRMRTNQQNRIIHSLVGRWEFTGDDKAEMVFDITGGRTASTKEMTFEEANVMIKRLNGQPIVQPLEDKSRRTIQNERHKAGVEQIATATHVDFMNRLRRERGMSDEGLGDLSARINKGVRKPRTSKEVNRVIEAIKQMNTRDRAFSVVKKDKEDAA